MLLSRSIIITDDLFCITRFEIYSYFFQEKSDINRILQLILDLYNLAEENGGYILPLTENEPYNEKIKKDCILSTFSFGFSEKKDMDKFIEALK